MLERPQGPLRAHSSPNSIINTIDQSNELKRLNSASSAVKSNNNINNSNSSSSGSSSSNTTTTSNNTNITSSSSNNSSTSSLNSNSSNSNPSDSTSITTTSNSNSKLKYSPCSPSILLNPLPPNKKKNKMTVLITHYPPKHYLSSQSLNSNSNNNNNNSNNNGNSLASTSSSSNNNNNNLNVNGNTNSSFNNSPPHSGNTRSRSSSLTGIELHPAPPISFPINSEHFNGLGLGLELQQPQQSNVVRLEQTEEDEGGANLQTIYSEASPRGRPLESNKGKGKLTFAPLPPGRRMFRSNSLTIGVAARASMLSSQGGGSAQPRARYAGPQQMWYQPGAPLPDDVYTYKDVQKGLTKLWSKVRRRSSSSTMSSKSVADALAMEKEGKGSGREIEHIEDSENVCIEEGDENEIDDDDDHDEGGGEGQDEKVVVLMEGLGLYGIDVEERERLAGQAIV